MLAFPSTGSYHICSSNKLLSRIELNNCLTKPECIPEIAGSTRAREIFLLHFVSGIQLFSESTGTILASLPLPRCSTDLTGKLLGMISYKCLNVYTVSPEDWWGLALLDPPQREESCHPGAPQSRPPDHPGSRHWLGLGRGRQLAWQMIKAWKLQLHGWVCWR